MAFCYLYIPFCYPCIHPCRTWWWARSMCFFCPRIHGTHVNLLCFHVSKLEAVSTLWVSEITDNSGKLGYQELSIHTVLLLAAEPVCGDFTWAHLQWVRAAAGQKEIGAMCPLIIVLLLRTQLWLDYVSWWNPASYWSDKWTGCKQQGFGQTVHVHGIHHSL